MRWILYGAATLLFSMAPSVSVAQVEQVDYVSLSAYLDALNQAGRFRIVYSSSVVTEDMQIAGSLSTAATRDELLAVLDDFGLAATDGPAGSLLIVRGASSSEDAAPHLLQVPEPVPIPEVVVTSSLHRLLYASPQSHSYLNRELAARIPGKGDETLRLVNRLPGVAGGEISVRGHVRGGEQNEVLFLFDGLRLYEPYHLKDFQSVATIINPSAIAGIDTFTGAFPGRYGDRMSGVTSIDMRRPGKALETELALSFFNTSATSLGQFGGGDKGEWLFAARRGNLDIIADLIDPERGSPDYQDYLAHVAWDFGRLGELSANLLYSKDKLSLDDPDRGESAGADYRNQVFWLKWQADWSDNLSATTLIAVSDISDQRVGTLRMDGVVSGSLRDSREFDAVELRQDWTWLASEQWMLRFGFDLKQLDATYRFSSERTLSAPFSSLFNNAPQTDRDFYRDPSGAQYAAYTELRWQPFAKLTIDLALRWDQQNYTTASDDEQFSPRFSALYRVGERTDVRIGWGQYYQAQEINELQLSDGVAEFFPAQRAEHFVARLEHRLSNEMDVSLSLYRKSFRDLRPRFENRFNTLTLLPELQFDRVAIAANEAEALGAELALYRGGAEDNLLWWVSYGWSQVEDKTATGKVPRSWDQTHTLKAGMSWAWGRWNLSLAGEAHSGWPTTALAGELVSLPAGGDELALEVGSRNALRYPTYHTLDIRVSRDFDLALGDLNVFLEVTNLYNRDNPCCIEYSRGADGGLVSEQRSWLPALPNLGVVWRF